MSYFSDRKRIVSVIGSSEPSEKEYNLALGAGHQLALQGCIIVCGGKGGVMEAVCRGAAQEGGISIGFLPYSVEEANPYVTIPLATCLGEARNLLVVNSGEGIISIGGAFGTLSELGFALKSGKPLIGLGTWQVRDPEGRTFPAMIADSSEEAVKKIIAAIDHK